MDDLCTNPKVSKTTARKVVRQDRVTHGNSSTAHAVLWPTSLTRKRWNLWYDMIWLAWKSILKYWKLSEVFYKTPLCLAFTVYPFKYHRTQKAKGGRCSPVNSLIASQYNQRINHQIILSVFLLSDYFYWRLQSINSHHPQPKMRLFLQFLY